MRRLHAPFARALRTSIVVVFLTVFIFVIIHFGVGESVYHGCVTRQAIFSTIEPLPECSSEGLISESPSRMLSSDLSIGAVRSLQWHH